MSRPKLSAGFCFLNSYEREEFLHLKRFFYLRCSLTKPYRTVTQKLKYVPTDTYRTAVSYTILRIHDILSLPS